MDVLRAEGLRKKFKVKGRDTVAAVDGIDISLRSSEVLGIIGGNGAGKSTVVSMLAGQLVPDAGTVSVDGLDLAARSREVRMQIGRRMQLVQQDPFDALSPVMTIEELVAEPLEVHGEARGESLRREAVERALRDVRLPISPEFLGRRTSQLSGGQLQRVSLARALVLNPDIIILDEPVSMLDPSEQAEMLQLLKALQTARGLSMIFVSHDIAVVVRLADRVMVLDQGRVVEEMPGEELLRNAKHPVTHALLAASGASTAPQSPSQLNPPNHPHTMENHQWTVAVS